MAFNNNYAINNVTKTEDADALRYRNNLTNMGKTERNTKRRAVRRVKKENVRQPGAICATVRPLPTRHWKWALH